jgi:hypothetical protein
MATRTNYNGAADAGESKEIAGENERRVQFVFHSLGDTFILNFGDDATSEDVLTVFPRETVVLTNNDAYDIKSTINVYCESASSYEAQAKE